MSLFDFGSLLNFGSMANWQIFLVASYALVVAISMLRHFGVSYEFRRMHFLTPRSPQIDQRGAPLVSVLVPAKDEEETIENCIKSLQDQNYLNVEILVVDDRSNDNTANIVRNIAVQDSRVKLISVKSLPEGWTGKTHALHLGQKHARGKWLYYVDADTTQHPNALSVLLNDAIEHDVDMESVIPRLEGKSFWENVIQPVAGIFLMLLYPLSRVNNPACKDYGFANGQFILIRRKAYNKIGGHEAVRDKFVEDIQLGRHVRQAGLNLRVAMAPELMSVRMYSSMKQILSGWTRIFYSAVDAQPKKLYALSALLAAFSVLPYAIMTVFGTAMLLGNFSTYVTLSFGLAVIHEIGQMAVYARVYLKTCSSMRFLLFRIFAVGVMMQIFGRTIRTCRTHHVVWRGTQYSSELKRAA